MDTMKVEPGLDFCKNFYTNCFVLLPVFVEKHMMSVGEISSNYMCQGGKQRLMGNGHAT